ncbi:MAG TPA: LPS export ABC transporter periplasmic protein LptC [Pyrinomonadaceae bacterium]|nr:LPS export ABC transporter periplasmic protein LptC [Pyrinomonadaceae bacterium]
MKNSEVGEKATSRAGTPLRARLPKYLGLASIALLLISVVVIIVSFFRTGPEPEFRMQGFPASLSKDVVAIVSGYERREMDGEVTRYILRADKATSFADNHQELENVYLEVFNETDSSSDRITANKAIYVPAEEKAFTAYFAGTVNVETRDGLKVETEQLTYDKRTETALAEEAVKFNRLNVNGSSFGASVRISEKLLQLFRDVRIETVGGDGSERTVLTAGNADYFQAADRIELGGDVRIETSSAGSVKPRTLAASRANADLAKNSAGDREIKTFELFDNVDVTTFSAGGAPTRIRADYALYQKPDDRFDLRGSVNITTVDGDRHTEIRSESAVYRQTARLADLAGNSTIIQAPSTIKGDSIHAVLAEDRSVDRAEVTGNAQVVQSLAERTTNVTGHRIIANFSEGRLLERAQVLGNGNAVVTPANPTEYSKLTLSAPRSIDLAFIKGLLSTVVTGGRTNVSMTAPNRTAEASDKTLAADSITTRFNSAGSDISHVLANGNAELAITPLIPSPGIYRTTVYAPTFNCEFFERGNDPKLCIARTNTKTVRVPTQSSANRGTQNITSETLYAHFSAQTREIETLEALGNARFSELERNASARKIIYTPANQFVRLREGEPNVWDDKARAKAPEIDWDMANQRSELRGGVSTTYYRSGAGKGATPFGKSDRPIYVTASQAQFDHRADVAYYNGNARGWQDRNYVRGERMVIDDRKGHFTAEENVQSLLYDAKRTDGSVTSNQPVHASAQRMIYERDQRIIRYENSVDIRQGPDRVTGDTARISLSESNDPTVTEVEKNVVISQPTRRASADFARFDNSAETLLLRGSPATIDDRQQGRSQAAEFVLNFKEDRFVGTSPASRPSTGRIRTVYKLNNN